MNNKKDTSCDWTDVMGNNVVYPIQSMLYRPTKILRKCFTPKDGGKGNKSIGLTNVIYDIHFVVWRLANVLKHMDKNDEDKLREVFELVLMEINNREINSGEANDE
jgi:hypothetical protein